MARHFGFGKHSRRSPADELLMPVWPFVVIGLTVATIIAGAMLLR